MSLPGLYYRRINQQTFSHVLFSKIDYVNTLLPMLQVHLKKKTNQKLTYTDHHLSQISHFPDMDVISDKFEPMSPGVIDHVWGFFSGVRQRGLQTLEEMLRDGSYITAIGELSQSQSGALKIQPPRDGLPLYLTTATKSSLLKRLASSRDFLRFVMGFYCLQL